MTLWLQNMGLRDSRLAFFPLTLTVLSVGVLGRTQEYGAAVLCCCTATGAVRSRSRQEPVILACRQRVASVSPALTGRTPEASRARAARALVTDTLEPEETGTYTQ